MQTYKQIMIFVLGVVLTSAVALACVNPTDDMYINADTDLCTGDFALTDTGGDGILIVNSSNVAITCEGATNMTGDGTGWAVDINGFDNVNITGCDFYSYGRGIYIRGGSDNILMDNNNFTVVSTTGSSNGAYHLDNASNIQIYNTYLDGCDGMVFTENNIIEDVTVENLTYVSTTAQARYGAYLKAGINRSSWNHIRVNRTTNTMYYGMLIYASAGISEDMVVNDLICDDVEQYCLRTDVDVNNITFTNSKAIETTGNDLGFTMDGSNWLIENVTCEGTSTNFCLGVPDSNVEINNMAISGSWGGMLASIGGTNIHITNPSIPSGVLDGSEVPFDITGDVTNCSITGGTIYSGDSNFVNLGTTISDKTAPTYSLNISNNEVYDSPIGLYSGNAFYDIILEHNNFYSIGPGNAAGFIVMPSASDDNTIRYNTFNGEGSSWTNRWMQYNTPGTDNIFYYNDIIDNEASDLIQANGASVVANVTNNWWGTTNSTLIGTLMSANSGATILYDPILTDTFQNTLDAAAIFDGCPVGCSGDECACVAMSTGTADPSITNVESISNVNLADCASAVATCRFNASDGNGYSDLNTSTAQCVLSKTGETTRSSSSCVQLSGAGEEARFECNVTFQYYDGAGTWDVNVSIEDNSGTIAYNDTTTMTVNSLDATNITDTAVSCGSDVAAGTNDVGCDNQTVTNCGNNDYSRIDVTGYLLNGTRGGGSTNEVGASQLCANDAYLANDGCDQLTEATPVSLFGSSLYNLGANRFALTTVDGSAGTPDDVWGFDINEDNYMDILVTEYGSDSVSWYENNATNGFTKRTIATGLDRAHYADVADIDGDGDLDVAAVAYGESAGEVAWYENNGTAGGWAESVVLVGGAIGPIEVDLVDLDEDTDMDMIIAEYDAGNVVWLENNGTENFTRNVIASLTQAHSAVASDLDGDNDLDVVAVGSSANTLIWYENNGTESFSSNSITTSLNNPKHVKVVDMDDDNDNDLVVSNSGAGQVLWYENNGTGTFTEYTIDSACSAVEQISVGDVDADGDVDVAATCGGSNSISWYMNDGSESFTEYTVASSISLPHGVDIVDVNGDGWGDILGAIWTDADVAWYENVHPGTRDIYMFIDVPSGILGDVYTSTSNYVYDMII